MEGETLQYVRILNNNVVFLTHKVKFAAVSTIVETAGVGAGVGHTITLTDPPYHSNVSLKASEDLLSIL
jgi:hypothetical protein